MQAFLLTWLITNMLKKLFFGTLRAAEIEVLDRWRHSSVIAPYESHIVVLSCLNYPQQFRLSLMRLNHSQCRSHSCKLYQSTTVNT